MLLAAPLTSSNCVFKEDRSVHPAAANTAAVSVLLARCLRGHRGVAARTSIVRMELWSSTLRTEFCNPLSDDGVCFCTTSFTTDAKEGSASAGAGSLPEEEEAEEAEVAEMAAETAADEDRAGTGAEGALAEGMDLAEMLETEADTANNDGAGAPTEGWRWL
eukprot:1140281-Pleurochrysis_carterae.AAC.1